MATSLLRLMRFLSQSDFRGDKASRLCVVIHTNANKRAGEVHIHHACDIRFLVNQFFHENIS